MLKWISEDGNAEASVTFDRMDALTGRYQWTWELRLVNVEDSDDVVVTRSDLQSPTYDPCGALQSLASFLSAWEEAWSYPNSDNGDLFPDEAHQWANYYSDEFNTDIHPE